MAKSIQAQALHERARGGAPIWAGRIFFGIATFVLLMMVFAWRGLGDPWGPGTSALIAYVLVGLHIALVGRRVSPMDPLVWIPIGMLLFHFGVPVAIEWVGLIGSYDPWSAASGTILGRGYCVALLAAVAFVWGIHLAGVSDLTTPPPPDDRSLGIPALLFTIGALAMTAVGIAIVGPGALFGLYHEWWDAKLLGADQRFIDTGLVFSGAGVYALLASDERGARWRRWFAYLVLMACLFIAIQKGDRTTMTTIAVGAGWCYSQRIRKLRWAPVLAAAFVGLLLFPVIREWRAERNLDDSSRASVQQLLGESIYGLGSSAMAIVYTIELVPARKDYEWGATFLAAGLNAIPNLGLTKGKWWATDDPTDTPSVWITWQIAPEWAATGGGYGFAMAAEWYYNFGMLGMVIGMAFTGYGVTRVRNASRRSSLALVWSATLFAGVSIWIRNVAGYATKVAVWPVVGLWVILRIVRLLRGRAARRPEVESAGVPAAP